MVDVDISIIFAGLSIAASIVYYASVLRNANKTQQMQLETRQAQLFMQIYERFNDLGRSEIITEVLSYEWEDNDEFWERYSYEADPDSYRKWNYVAGFFEGVGVLVKRKLIDPEIVDDLMSASTLMFWEKYGPAIIDGRERLNIPQLWEWTEYLYQEIKDIADRQHPGLKA